MGQIRHYQLTLNGAAQQLSSALPGTESAVIEDVSFRELKLQADDGNTNPIYVGGDNTVTAAAHGLRIPAPTAGVPAAPETFGGYDTGPLKLSKFWVIGTNNEILNVLGLTF